MEVCSGVVIFGRSGLAGAGKKAASRCLLSLGLVFTGILPIAAADDLANHDALASRALGGPPVYCGNPVNVITGNKYQRERDGGPLPGEISVEFTRHYNSRGSSNGVLGHGWRHDYETRLHMGAGSFMIHQGDGRIVEFKKSGSTYNAVAANDGELVPVEGGYDWRWPDGRVLQFMQDGRLSAIQAPYGGYIRLNYAPGGQLASVSDSYGRRLSFNYYPNGRLAGVVDPGNKKFRYAYDKNGNLEYVRNPEGGARRYHYEDSRDPHNLTGITDERGIRFASYAYDDDDRAVMSEHVGGVGRLSFRYLANGTEVINSRGRAFRYTVETKRGVPVIVRIEGQSDSACRAANESYTYNADLLLTSTVKDDGRTRHYQYDHLNRLVEIAESNYGNGDPTISVVAKYGYLGESRRPVVITKPSIAPGKMHQWWLAHDDDGRIREVLESGYTPNSEGGYDLMERVTRYGYEKGRLAFIDGPAPGDADRRTYHYDANGRLKHVAASIGNTPTIESFDAYGRPIRVRDGNGDITSLEYNVLGRLARVARAPGRRSGLEVSFEYDAVGNLTAAVGPKGRVEAQYDDAGRPVVVRLPDGNTKNWRWDTRSNLLQRTLADGAGNPVLAMSYVYDELDRLVEAKNQDGHKAAYSYGVQGFLERYINPLGVVTEYVTDPIGRVRELTRAAGTAAAVSESIDYDINGAAVALIDGRNNSARQVVDDFGHRLWRSTPDGGVIIYRYDALGQVAARVDESGIITRLDHDDKGRLIGIGGFDQPPSTRFTYGEHGEPQLIDGPNQRTRYRYDMQGRVVETAVTLNELKKTFTTLHRYDARGRVAEKVLPDGQTMRFTYDTDDAVTPSRISRERWLWNSDVVGGLKFDDAGRLLDVEYGNGQKARYRYDPYGRMRSISDPDGTTRQYSYDALGRLVNSSGRSGTSSFAYDPLGRLVEMDTGGTIQSWRYDVGGNRVEAKEHGTMTAYRYAADSNHLISAGDKTYNYNTVGAPIRSGKLRYEYNAGGRPSKIYRDGKLLAEYVYNSEGERIKKVVHGGAVPLAVYYLYENKRLVAEVDSGGRIQTQYIYAGTRLIAKLDGADVHPIYSDNRYAPVRMTDPEGNIIWSAEYDAFGRAQVDTRGGRDVTLNVRLPGQYYDAETGTHYNIHRDYDPATGRYLTPDPLGIVAGPNTYAYAANDPVNRIDPMGLYDEYIHYYMTYFLATVAGLDQETVQVIALAAQYIDDNPLTSPVLGGTPALEAYHFIMPRLENPGSPLSIYLNPQAEQLDRLYDAAMLFDRACPANGQPAGKVKAQLYGEYLHAYADTYAHRDENNNPYGVWNDKGGYGHMLDGTYPDRTYNFHVDTGSGNWAPPRRTWWEYQEVRTLEAEKQMFYKLRVDFRSEIQARRATPQTPEEYQKQTDELWRQIAGDGNGSLGEPGSPNYKTMTGALGIVQQFNQEHDDNEKIKLLNKWLAEHGGSLPSPHTNPMPDHRQAKSDARDNRLVYLAGFESGDLPGVLLPSPLPTLPAMP